MNESAPDGPAPGAFLRGAVPAPPPLNTSSGRPPPPPPPTCPWGQPLVQRGLVVPCRAGQAAWQPRGLGGKGLRTLESRPPGPLTPILSTPQCLSFPAKAVTVRGPLLAADCPRKEQEDQGEAAGAPPGPKGAAAPV